MQNKIKLTLSAISVASLLALAACGGGGDGGGSSTPAAVTPAPTPAPPPPTIVVQGSAPTVTADPMAVVFVPQTETSTKSVLQSIASNAFPGSLQKATAEGGYKQIGIDANSLISLTAGKIVDVTGNGDFAIGRWTDGSSSVGSFSVNQSAHYVVGKPLALAPNLTVGAPDIKANCTSIASTRPTAVSGNFAPGTLNSATATVDLTFATLDSFHLDRRDRLRCTRHRQRNWRNADRGSVSPLGSFITSRLWGRIRLNHCSPSATPCPRRPAAM
ncbi:hypothetical protein [Cupriavidus basilensis]